MIIDNPPCKTQKAHNKRFAHPPPLSYLWMRPSFLAKLRLLSSSFLFAHLHFFLDIKNGGCYANSVFYICESACIWSLRLSSSKILVCSPTHHPFKGDTFPLLPLWKLQVFFMVFINCRPPARRFEPAALRLVRSLRTQPCPCLVLLSSMSCSGLLSGDCLCTCVALQALRSGWWLSLAGVHCSVASIVCTVSCSLLSFCLDGVCSAHSEHCFMYSRK